MSDIGEQLGDALVSAVRSTVGDLGPDTVLLTSEVGRPVSLEGSGLQPVALRQRASDFVDVLPQPGLTGFVPELDAFSSRYASLLGAATRRPGLPDDVGAAVDRLLAAAKQRFAEGEAARIDQPTSYWETAQEPVDWFNGTGSHWQTMTVGEGAPPPPIPPPSPYDRYRHRWGWRIPIYRPEIEQRWARLGVGALADAARPAPPGSRPERPRIRPPAKNGPSAVMAERAVTDEGVGAVPTGRPETSAARASLAVPAAARAVLEGSEVAAPTSTGFRIEMSYAVVTLRRAWLDTSWWSNPHWHAPGVAEGSWSAGDVGVADQLLAAVPVALVVVKDVHISASWTGEDQQRLAALPPTLGPFALAGGRVSDGTVTIPGIQVIGWLCKVPPTLPPRSQPALERALVEVGLPVLRRGAAGPYVRLLQGLLMAAGRFEPKPDLMNGTFGPRTERAVAEFQAAREIGPAPAGVDAATWTALLTPETPAA